jgi:IS30 family transposase
MGYKINHRLDIEDRMVIQACLHDRMQLGQISHRIQVSKSTICRELHRNCVNEPGGQYPCPTLKRLIVCNTCIKKSYCYEQKRYYNFKLAQKMSSSRNHNSRSVTKLSESALTTIDDIVTDGVSLGQSLHHIYASDASLQSLCCERTIRASSIVAISPSDRINFAATSVTNMNMLRNVAISIFATSAL